MFAISLSVFCFKKDSAMHPKARFRGGSSTEDFILQMGHSRQLFSFQYCCRHNLQKLWLHFSRTGSLKISKHIEQQSSSSEIEASILRSFSLGLLLSLSTCSFFFFVVLRRLASIVMVHYRRLLLRSVDQRSTTFLYPRRR